jgi:glycosyltransferase involved in cell wall biosynthesis
MEARRVSAAAFPRFAARLGVLTHVPHFSGADGVAKAYEPYVREMRLWADLFEEVEICAPRAQGPPAGNLAGYERENIRWAPFSYHQGTGLFSPLRRLARLFPLAAAVNRSIRRADLVHLRSPGHVALVGAVLVRLARRRSLTKWAGENGPFVGERFPSRLERWIQNSTPSARHPMLVYGPAKLPHQIEFFPALMSRAELSRAAELSRRRRWEAPWRLLSVARLERVKGLDLALRGLALLRRRKPELSWIYAIIGEGPARRELETLARDEGIADSVRFEGAKSFAQAQEDYAQAHLVLMPGVKEGWPKVIAEAWAHGAIPVAAAAGIVPHLLTDARSGVAFAPDPASLAQELSALLEEPQALPDLARHNRGRADALSLESFRESLERVLEQRCGLS